MGFHGSKKTRVGKGREKERVGLEEIWLGVEPVGGYSSPKIGWEAMRRIWNWNAIVVVISGVKP